MATHPECLACFGAIDVVLRERKLRFFYVYVLKEGMTNKIKKEMDDVFSVTSF